MTQHADENLSKTPNLIDLLSREGELQGTGISWGPVIGDDEKGGGAPASHDNLLQDENLSDSRLKTDIAQVGTTVYGLPLYNFKYIGKAEVYEGVMAQDVLKVMPSAVLTGSDGFYRVKYKDLGLQMRRVA